MNNERLNKLVDETLSSLDETQRAATKPFLFTRLTAKMQSKQTTVWDNALQFLSKPTVAFACILLVICINAAVFTINNGAESATDEQYIVADDYNTDIVAFNEIENLEP